MSDSDEDRVGDQELMRNSYVQGVIESYVANKQKQGEDPAEVTQKLVFIAQKVGARITGNGRLEEERG